MTHGSLFTGIGGFDLAAEWMSWENIFQVENDKFCISKLEKNFPDVKRYEDIKKFDGTPFKGTINIISGGFPCQGFSVAGKQKGKDDPRWLWPEMLRVIREIQPAWIVGENVPGIIKMALEDICSSLEGEDYAIQPFIIPSASIGAWDKRERVWIIAYNQEFRDRRLSIQQRGQNKAENINTNWEIKRNWLEVASELCRSNARVPHRMDRIKALGNSVNPYVVYEIFKAIEKIKNPELL